MLLARVTVQSTERISPSYVRITLGGPELADFGIDGPAYDQRFKLLMPAANGLPELSEDDWWTDLQALSDEDRCPVRTYTIRDVLGTGADTQIVFDVVLHPGGHGPGSLWAERAAPGDEVLVCVPRRGTFFGGIEWDPGAADRLLLAGDETALPAIASILGALPEDARGDAFIEVPHAEDVQELTAPEGLAVRWLPREGAEVGSAVVPAVQAHLGLGGATAEIETDDPEEDELWETPTYSGSGEEIAEVLTPGPGSYAWIAGENALVKTLRRNLVTDLGMPRQQVAFMGYWRIGVSMRA